MPEPTTTPDPIITPPHDPATLGTWIAVAIAVPAIVIGIPVIVNWSLPVALILAAGLAGFAVAWKGPKR